MKTREEMLQALNEISEAEIIKILHESLDFVNGVKEEKKRARARKAKADFFNLNEVVKNSEVIFF